MWPDLVYTELISLILCSVVLIVWSIFLKAPLEQPANPAQHAEPVEGAVVSSSACRKCWSTSTRGSPASCCPA